jgi:Tfp pilus assembly protein PilF
MKFLAALVIFLAVALPRARAQESADDQYVVIYSLMQQADTLETSGEPRQALDEFVEVQGELQKFKKIFPDWHPAIVNYRLNYLAEKIAEVTAQLPVTNAPPPVASAPVTNSPATNSNFETQQLSVLRGQMQQLQADNVTLAAKLKEALAVQPAAIDPRELARAQEQVRWLMKENDLLKVSLAEEKTGTVGGPEPDALKQSQAALAAQTERADKLAAENQALQARVKSLLASADAIEALREENALLKKQLAELKSPATNSTEVASLNSELAAAREQVAALQLSLQTGQLEKAALENRVKQLQASATNSAPADQTENEARIRDLTQERDDLLAKLGEANKELYGRKKQDVAAQVSALTDEVNTLRARLAVDEAQVIPYTPEELALFKQAAPLPANPQAEDKSVNQLPEGSASLVAEAQDYFVAKQYDKAEDDYLQILNRDQNNGLVLANLAAIELEQGKLDDAEKHIAAALKQSPNDAYNLSTFGHLKLMQEKYDDALDALSRAAKLDPQNPEIENYLGLALANKGLRLQAETAFRTAIQIDPGCADAHNNLAVIYINQQPPSVELARWHYQKALDAGMPRNPDLEKVLANDGAPVDAP